MGVLLWGLLGVYGSQAGGVVLSVVILRRWESRGPTCLAGNLLTLSIPPNRRHLQLGMNCFVNFSFFHPSPAH